MDVYNAQYGNSIYHKTDNRESLNLTLYPRCRSSSRFMTSLTQNSISSRSTLVKYQSIIHPTKSTIYRINIISNNPVMQSNDSLFRAFSKSTVYTRRHKCTTIKHFYV